MTSFPSYSTICATALVALSLTGCGGGGGGQVTASAARLDSFPQSVTRSLPGARVSIETTTEATDSGTPATVYRVSVDSVAGVQTVAVLQGSDPSAKEVTGRQIAHATWSIKVPNAEADDPASTFVRIVQSDGNSVEVAMADPGQ